MKAPKKGGYSNLVVGGIMGAVLVYLAFYIPIAEWGMRMGLAIGVGIACVLIYEGWTLINSYEEDTLSEGFWRLSARPLVPWCFGGLSLWLLASQTLTNPYLIAAWFMLQGHFFWQAQQEFEKIQEREIVKAAVTGAAVTPTVVFSGGEAVKE